MLRREATALWYTAPGICALRAAEINPPGDGQLLVRTLFSGISRGTERLIASGAVPADEYARMRGPSQEGDFPFPVKYGYCAVGILEAGPPEMLGKMVFALHPHQSRFIVEATMASLVPEHVPPRRAVLAANMETALNSVWDSGAGPGDSIVVVGGGVVGLLVAFLCARMPGADVTLVDVRPSRAALAELFGARFCEPKNAPEGADCVFHTSASAAGLATALASAGFEGTVVEMSWYGAHAVQAPLGAAFHSQRLRLISSQVGHVSPSRRARWPHARRLAKALALLDDARLDALLDHELAFTDAPEKLPALLDKGDAMGIVLTYGSSHE